MTHRIIRGFLLAGFGALLLLVGGLSALAAAEPATLSVVMSDDSQIVIDVTALDLSSEIVTTAGGPFTAVEAPEHGFTSEIGAPRLPVLRGLVEIPVGASWDTALEDAVYREEPVGAPILPLQPPRPKTKEPPPPFAYDGAAYREAGYTKSPAILVEEGGFLRGRRLAQVSVRVVDYDPSAGMIRALESGRIRVRLNGADPMETARLRDRYQSPFFDGVSRSVILNAEASRYLPSGEIGYLVISTPAFFGNADLADYLAWKAQKGFHVTHVSTDATGPTKELIKAYIQTAYDGWEIPPTFVTLVGDTPAIPHWVGIGADSPATDLNYTMLAGTDYLPDVALGRISVVNATELQNILRKTLSFERVEWSGNDDWERHATFMASVDNYTVTEGTHNYCINTYLLPLGYQCDRLYCYTYGATTQQVRDAFNAGRSQGTYSGHGAETYWADGPVFYQSDVRNLVNTVYPFIQAYTCLSGNYSVGECFGETWIRTARAAIAYFGSSVTSYWTEDDILQKRVYQGWYDNQNANEPVDRTWIGGMTIYGKLKYYDYFGNTSTTRRYFEMYNIMGDASVDIWTSVPRVAAVTVPTALLAGQQSFDVTVQSVPYAMISIQKSDGGNGIFMTAWGDAAGHAVVSLPEPLTPGSLHLTITAHDIEPHFSTIDVIQPSGPYLIYEANLVEDYEDHDGTIDAGQMFGLRVTLENIGVDPATGLTAGISCNDPYLEMSVPVEPSIPDILPGGFGTMEGGIPFLFRGTTPDQHVATFGWHAHGNEGDWNGQFACTINAPAISAGSCLVDDSAPGGDGNGTADPGETVSLYLWLANTGHATARDLNGVLATGNPNVSIIDASAMCLIAPEGESALLSGFQVTILPGCPSPATIPFDVDLTGANGFEAAIAFGLSIGAFFDDAEADRGWTLGAPDDNATSGLWVRADPVGTSYSGQPCQPEDDHTPAPGTICFVTGNGTIGGAATDSDIDGGKTTLRTPVFPLEGATSATVSYWRWYTNNLGNNPGQDYWDVDVTSDGVNWTHLEHTTASANSWTYYAFNVGDFVSLTDQVRFRFVAQDQSPGSLVEAAVDDFTLTVVRTPAADAPQPAGMMQTGIVSCGPNPSSGALHVSYRIGEQSHARIGLYDIGGRLVRILHDSPATPGEKTLVFDAVDGAGKSLASGIYFLRLETPAVLQIRQVTVLK